VGYAGGTTPHPTYHDIGDHTEALRVWYDPSTVSFRELLEVFWSAHTPTSRSWSTQYKAILFFHDEEQKRLAFETRDEASARRGGATIHTELREAENYTPAEDYHQKYYLKLTPPIIDDMKAVYPDPGELTRSTAAARLNGFIGGYGEPERIEELLPELGLSEKSGRRLLSIVKSRSSLF
jgi:peptide-methionine (S)-S-oxide reductase